MWGRRRADKIQVLMTGLVAVTGFVWAGYLGAIFGALGDVALKAISKRRRPKAIPILYLSLNDVLRNLGGHCRFGLCIVIKFDGDDAVLFEALDKLQSKIARTDTVLHSRFGYFVVLLRADKRWRQSVVDSVVMRLQSVLEGSHVPQVGVCARENKPASVLLKGAVASLQQGQVPVVPTRIKSRRPNIARVLQTR